MERQMELNRARQILPALQQELAAALPHATLHIAPDAGHFLPLECPDFCAHALAEWLAPAPVHP